MEAGMPLEQFLITVAGIVGTVVALRGPIGRAIAARIEGRRPPDDETALELDDLRSRVATLEEGQSQLTEVQERLDFAERLLAQERQDRPRLSEQ
jgi:hypothetical protein